jgi:O-antigen ligase
MGVGPSRNGLHWRRRGATYEARYVHNEYLQTAVDFGVVGLALLVACVAAIARILVRRKQLRPLLLLASTCIVACFDFVWHIPVVPLFVAALICVETQTKSRTSLKSIEPRVRLF